MGEEFEVLVTDEFEDWYETHIPLAEALWEKHLEELKGIHKKESHQRSVDDG